MALLIIYVYCFPPIQSYDECLAIGEEGGDDDEIDYFSFNGDWLTGCDVAHAEELILSVKALSRCVRWPNLNTLQQLSSPCPLPPLLLPVVFDFVPSMGRLSVRDDEHTIAASDSVTTHICVAFMPTCVSVRRHSRMHSGASADPIERNRMRLKKVRVAGWLYTQL